ncbi:hypothetical protein BO71DRAFT_110530 [Aspergillus ellipticus CBS 707.79]|uniref:Uncharacterized protein n=1 Tax=Aspergillus ellipticus CBS 707.79 TaxID=1448320 RepID=A0A319EE64_9EURO|nr:hypothetical protein BO71DRAFT_110530 [Aspergillus ellipticus CBS 707.79]
MTRHFRTIILVVTYAFDSTCFLSATAYEYYCFWSRTASLRYEQSTALKWSRESIRLPALMVCCPVLSRPVPNLSVLALFDLCLHMSSTL